jgi:CheY-like chemotaxis protein
MCVVARTTCICQLIVELRQVLVKHVEENDLDSDYFSKMDDNKDPKSLILVVEDVHETRDGIEKLLQADGYRVAVARDERDGIESAQRKCPDLILVSLAGSPRVVIATARRIRDCAGVGEHVPVVAFCIEEIKEGGEVALGQNVHVTRPDNFNQLRSLLMRLLSRIPIAV